MHKGTVVEQILRSLSFDVEAVPQDNLIEVTTTSKTTPLNVKIRVRKKDKNGIQNGAVSLFKPNHNDIIPERIRLVSSDQTIMSFNVIMEQDFQKPIRKPRTNILGIFKPTICLGAQADEDEYAYLPRSINKADSDEDSKSKSNETTYTLSKNDDRIKTSLLRKNKDFFGKCKPGGCLDPPFGEDKDPYTISMEIEQTSTSEYTTKDKTSSIFSKILYKWNKKSNSEQEFQKSNSKEFKTESILNLFHAGSLHTNSYSNSIITYPPTLHSSEIRLKEDKTHFNKTNDDTLSKQNSFDESSGTYFTVPKKPLNSKDKSNVAKKKDDGDEDYTKCDTTELDTRNSTDSNEIQGKTKSSLINQTVIGIPDTNNMLVTDIKTENIKSGNIETLQITDMEVKRNLQDSKAVRKLNTSTSFLPSEHKSNSDIAKESKRDKIKYIGTAKNHTDILINVSKSVPNNLEAESKEHDYVTIDSKPPNFNDGVEHLWIPEIYSNNSNMLAMPDSAETGKTDNYHDLDVEPLTKLNDLDINQTKQKNDRSSKEQNYSKISDNKQSENYDVPSEKINLLYNTASESNKAVPDDIVNHKKNTNLDKNIELQPISNEKQLKVQNSTETGKSDTNYDSDVKPLTKFNDLITNQSKQKNDPTTKQPNYSNIRDNEESENYIAPSKKINLLYNTASENSKVLADDIVKPESNPSLDKHIELHIISNEKQLEVQNSTETGKNDNNHDSDIKPLKNLNDLNINQSEEKKSPTIKEQNYSIRKDNEVSENYVVPSEKSNLLYDTASESYKILADDIIKPENNTNLDKNNELQIIINEKQLDVQKNIEINKLNTETYEDLKTVKVSNLSRELSQIDPEMFEGKSKKNNESDTLKTNKREYEVVPINNLKSENKDQEFLVSGKSTDSLKTIPLNKQNVDINNGFDHSRSSSNFDRNKASKISDMIQQKSGDTSVLVSGSDVRTEFKTIPDNILNTKNNVKTEEELKLSGKSADNKMIIPFEKQSVEVCTETDSVSVHTETTIESQTHLNKNTESLLTLDTKHEMSNYDIVTTNTDKKVAENKSASKDDVVIYNNLLREGNPQKISLTKNISLDIPDNKDNDLLNIWENTKQPTVSHRIINTDHDRSNQFNTKQHMASDRNENIKSTDDILFMGSIDVSRQRDKAIEDTDDPGIYKMDAEKPNITNKINATMNLENVLTDSIIENHDKTYIHFQTSGADLSQIMDNSEMALQKANNQSINVRNSQNKIKSPENLITKSEKHESTMKPSMGFKDNDRESALLLSPSLNKHKEEKTDLLNGTFPHQNESNTENKLEENDKLKNDYYSKTSNLPNIVKQEPQYQLKQQVELKSDQSDLMRHNNAVINNTLPDDHSSSKILTPELRKKRTVAVTEIDFAIQSYLGDNNKVTVKSLNADIEADRYPNDTYVLIKRNLALNDEIKVPITLKHNLCIQVKSNKQDIEGGVSRGSEASFNYEMDISKRHETIADDIRRTLMAVHEEDLVPLRNTIIELRENITYLISQQIIIRDHMFKKVKHNRTIPPRKCGCMRK